MSSRINFKLGITQTRHETERYITLLQSRDVAKHDAQVEVGSQNRRVQLACRRGTQNDP